MATRKRNEWLDADNSEDEDEGHNASDNQEESRGAQAGRSIKRRKVSASPPDSDSDIDASFVTAPGTPWKPSRAGNPSPAGPAPAAQNASEDEGQDDDDDDLQDAASPKAAPLKTKTVKPLTATQLASSQRAAKRTGVIYISRIPPFMKPSTLRTLLAPYGQLNRLFLTPEDATTHARRVRSGGNKKKSYVDGWVEFASKRAAKTAVALLNGNIVGGKKGGYYHDDVWNLRYLKGFKWAHLTEQIAGENAARVSRLRVEVARTRRENEGFVRDVQRGKMLEGMRRGKGDEKGGDGEVGDVAAVSHPKRESDVRMKFKQNVARSKGGASEAQRPEQSEATSRVLSKLF